MIVKLTGIAHGDISTIEETVVQGNLVTLDAEENQKASNGVAFAATCKGVKIGYLPELDTLRKYYHATHNEKEQYRLSEWGKAVRATREQIKIDMDNNGQAAWKGRISTLLYSDGKTYIEFDEYSKRSQNGNAGDFKLSQVSVNFEWVECF